MPRECDEANAVLRGSEYVRTSDAMRKRASSRPARPLRSDIRLGVPKTPRASRWRRNRTTDVCDESDANDESALRLLRRGAAKVRPDERVAPFGMPPRATYARAEHAVKVIFLTIGAAGAPARRLATLDLHQAAGPANPQPPRLADCVNPRPASRRRTAPKSVRRRGVQRTPRTARTVRTCCTIHLFC